MTRLEELKAEWAALRKAADISYTDAANSYACADAADVADAYNDAENAADAAEAAYFALKKELENDKS